MTCSIEGCGRKKFRAGMCYTHYNRKRLGKDINAPILDKSARRHTDFSKLTPDELELEEGFIRMRVYRCRENFNSVIGIESRLFWKGEIRKHAQELHLLLAYKRSNE